MSERKLLTSDQTLGQVNAKLDQVVPGHSRITESSSSIEIFL